MSAWHSETIDRSSHTIIQVYVDGEIVGSLQFWNDEKGKESIKEWQTMMELMNERTSHKP